MSFTRTAYRSVLAAALEAGYAFVGVDGVVAPGRVCLLRHDVDADLGAAAELGRVESALGISATYYILLRSPIYNPFSRGNDAYVRELLDLGHRIGLHFDLAFAGSDAPVADELAYEAGVLSTMYGAAVGSYSFHQPSLSTVDPSTVIVEGLVSTWNIGGLEYVSDANKRLPGISYESLFRSARKPRLHLNIHPIWWAGDDADASPAALWDGALIRNLELSQAQLAATERAFGEPRRVALSPAREHAATYAR